MFWKRDHKIIEMECFDAESGEALYRVRMPVERLPESFEPQTTMHIREKDYTVIRAMPMTAAEFRRTGKLRLIMRPAAKVTMVDPHEILFSLATISNEWPPMTPGSSKAGKDVLELHEDDWRQVEMVCSKFGEEIESEIADIRQIHDAHCEGPGFNKVHVRRRLPQPLDFGELSRAASSRLTLLDLRSRFERATVLDGIALLGADGLVAGGFALRLMSGLELYGTSSSDGRIAFLCFADARGNNALERDLPALVALARANDLLLVDWCRCDQVAPDEQAFRDYFTRSSSGES